MQRLIRDYRLKIETETESFVIEPEINIVFTCDKSVTGGLNTLNVEIFNLSERKRLGFAKDPEQTKLIKVTLQVGFKGQLQNIFRGTVHRAKSERQDADIITTLECFDGGFGFFNAFSNKVVEGRSSYIDGLIADLPDAEKGRVSDAINQTSRPKVLMGHTHTLLNQLINDDENFYVENERVFITKKNEFVGEVIPLVSAKTGLKNVPTRDFQRVNFDCTLNQAVYLGGRIKLESTIAPYLNGIYKVESISYAGNYESGDWQQNVDCIPANGFVKI